MEKREMDKKKILKYVVITFAIAWTLSTVASIIKIKSDNPMTGMLIFNAALAIMMFTPMLAAIIVNHGLKGMGWKPKFKGNVKWLVFSIVSPMVMVILGFICFFAIYPELFALDLSYLIKLYESMGMDTAAVMKQIDSSGMSRSTLVIVTFLQAMIEGSFLNMFIAVGEEAGWRGFLYPELKKGFGKVKCWIFGGLIWSAFHYPAIIIGGHDYGLNYIGAPFLGVVAFTISCTALGVIHEIIYDKTKCIWYPALFHGAINAAFTMYNLVLNGEHFDKIGKLTILGPGMFGFLSCIPLVIVAIVMGVKAAREGRED